jgi:hypothetical protein
MVFSYLNSGCFEFDMLNIVGEFLNIPELHLISSKYTVLNICTICEQIIELQSTKNFYFTY